MVYEVKFSCTHDIGRYTRLTERLTRVTERLTIQNKYIEPFYLGGRKQRACPCFYESRPAAGRTTKTPSKRPTGSCLPLRRRWRRQNTYNLGNPRALRMCCTRSVVLDERFDCRCRTTSGIEFWNILCVKKLTSLEIHKLI